MRVVMVEPGKDPYVTFIGDELEDLQKAVGGYIEAVHPFTKPVVLICNEEGRLLNLPENRMGFRGTFFLCGECEDDLVDIPARFIPQLLGLFTEGGKDDHD